MTTTDYVNVIEALNEKFLNKELYWEVGWSFNYRDYGYGRMICFNETTLWDTENNSYNKENDLDWTEESLLKFCEKQYRDYITKLYRTLEL